MFNQTQVHYSSGPVSHGGQWLVNESAISGYMPGETRAFPVSHRIYWPKADADACIPVRAQQCRRMPI